MVNFESQTKEPERPVNILNFNREGASFLKYCILEK